MKSFRSLVSLVVLVSLPAHAFADDAGDDAGAGEAGVDVPVDASADDETRSRCLDGYDRRYVSACAGRAAGETCTFPDGEPGACAALRCLDEAGAPLTLCVALRGQEAPPFEVVDAGAGVPAAPELGLGGGCSLTFGRADAAGWVVVACAAALVLRAGSSSSSRRRTSRSW